MKGTWVTVIATRACAADTAALPQPNTTRRIEDRWGNATAESFFGFIKGRLSNYSALTRPGRHEPHYLSKISG
jgi:hypothetical protein